MCQKLNQNVGVGLKFWSLKSSLALKNSFGWRQETADHQLSLSQLVQGFTTNIRDEQNEQKREPMLWYVKELMEDATDISWESAKAANAVLLCEIERQFWKPKLGKTT